MKKIIANKIYDTDKAKLLGEHEHSNRGDFDWYREALYHKRIGEYFLHGVGGARTRYAVSLGQNSWGGGEKIIPLTYDAAREWAEKYLPVDEYEVIFGLPADDDGTTALHVQIDSATLAAVRQAASQAESTLAAWVANALRKALG